MKIKPVLIIITLLIASFVGFYVINKIKKNINKAESIDLVLPESDTNYSKQDNISVSVNEKLQYFINDKLIEKNKLESELLSFIDSLNISTITIRSDQDVELKHVVFIMDIANRNKIKSTLAVKSN